MDQSASAWFPLTYAIFQRYPTVFHPQTSLNARMRHLGTHCKNNSAVGRITVCVLVYYFKQFQLNNHKKKKKKNHLAVIAASYRAQFTAKCCAKRAHAMWARVLSNLGHSASFKLWDKHHTQELMHLAG